MTTNSDFVLYGEFKATLSTRLFTPKAIELLRGEGFFANVFNGKKIPKKIAITVECEFRPDQLPKIRLKIWEGVRFFFKRHDFDITVGEAQMLFNAIEYLGYVSDESMPITDFVETSRRTHLEEHTPSCDSLREDLKKTHWFADNLDIREYLDLKSNVATETPIESEYIDPRLNFWDFAMKCQRYVDGLGEGRFRNAYLAEFPYFVEMRKVNPDLYSSIPEFKIPDYADQIQYSLETFSDMIRRGLEGRISPIGKYQE